VVDDDEDGADGEVLTPAARRAAAGRLGRAGFGGGGRGAAGRGGGGASTLASMYAPPAGLMQRGSMQEAKDVATGLKRWLIVNVQSTEEFASHQINRDTWGHSAVQEVIKSNFVLWQTYAHADEGLRVATYYKLGVEVGGGGLPCILVLDPITGMKLKHWRGFVEPETLLVDLMAFLEDHPTPFAPIKRRPPALDDQPPPGSLAGGSAEDGDADLQKAIAASMRDGAIAPGGIIVDEDAAISAAVAASLAGPSVNGGAGGSKRASGGGTVPRSPAGKKVAATDKGKGKAPPEKPEAPLEPEAGATGTCAVAIRLPDGSRVQRRFLATDPLRAVHIFLAATVEGAHLKPFVLYTAMPPPVPLTETDKSLAELGLAGAVVVMKYKEE